MLQQWKPRRWSSDQICTIHDMTWYSSQTFVPININNDVYKSDQISEANDLDETFLEKEFTDQVLIEEDKYNGQVHLKVGQLSHSQYQP